MDVVVYTDHMILPGHAARAHVPRDALARGNRRFLIP